jgi:hypothetical protein
MPAAIPPASCPNSPSEISRQANATRRGMPARRETSMATTAAAALIGLRMTWPTTASSIGSQLKSCQLT